MDKVQHTQIWFQVLYITAAILWLFFWKALDGYRLMRSTIPKLWLPFVTNSAVLLLNAYLNSSNLYIATAGEEESLFDTITSRLGNVFTAATAVLAISAIIYTIRRQKASRHFVNFASYTFVFGLVSMFIIWIPSNEATGKFLLRHFQTVFLCSSVSLCMGSILILLQDLSIDFARPEPATIATPDRVPTKEEMIRK